MDGQEPGAGASNSPPASVVAESLNCILASPPFTHSERLTRFLRFVVTETLAGRSEQIKEYAVGVEVFDRGAAFDPRTDPVVRTEARRLRAKLREYYGTYGAGDAIEIELPRGGYCPVFRARAAAEAPLPAPPQRRWALPTLLLVSAAAALALGYLVWVKVAPRASPEALSIAVLPLTNLSAGVEQDYLADGMTESLTTELAKLGTLRVISTTSAMQYKGRKAPIARIAAELRVNYIVEGSVTVAGNRMRVRAQLIEAAADRHRWADDFDSDLGDVLRLQSEVARAIARQVDSRLAQRDRASTPPRAVRSEAYLAYLQGRYQWYKRTPEGIRQSLRFFKEAVDYDPTYAQAWAGLADAYTLQSTYAFAAPADAYPQARAAAERALQIDPTLPEAHTALAAILSDYYWDWGNVEHHFQRAIALNPNYALAHMWYSGFLAYNRGHHADALAHARLARDLDPLALIAHNNIGFVLYHARQFDAALEQLEKTQAMDPSFLPAHIHLGLVWIQKREYGRAVAALEEAVRLSADEPGIVAMLAYAFAGSGEPDRARELLRRLQHRGDRGEKVALALAIAHTGLGEKDRAFEWFDRACSERAWPLAMLSSEPLYDPLRADPRFNTLLRRLRLVP